MILFLSGVTLLTLTEINRRAVEKILIDQAEVQAMLSTVAVTDGLDAVIGSAERLTRFVARDLEGRVLTPAEVERIARNAVQDYPSIFGVSIAFEPRGLDAATERFGISVHRSNVINRFATSDLASPEQAYWNRDWYREVINKAQAVWSDPFFDQGGTDRNVVRIAMPFFRLVEGKREPIGVVAAVIELDWLRRLTNSNEFSDTAFAIIFSRTGKLLIHPKPNYIIAETMESRAEKTSAPELAQIRQNVLAKRQGTMSYMESMPRRRVHVNFKPTKTAGWGVVVGYDEAEFLKNQESFRILAALYLGATLLILGGIVIGVIRYALRPLGQLATAADEIAQRNLDCKIPESTRQDEVGLLTKSFRDMRDALKEQLLERRWASQSLEHQLKYNNLIIDSMGELVFVLTKALSISRINPAVTRIAGYTAADVIRSPLDRVVTLQSEGGNARVFMTALKDGQSIYNLKAWVIAKNGEKIPARLTLVPLLDSNNVVGGVVTLRVEQAAADTAAPNSQSPSNL